MTGSLFIQHDISRSPADDRTKPIAYITQNGGVRRIKRPQAAENLRPRMPQSTASSASTAVNRAAVQVSASTVGALSP